MDWNFSHGIRAGWKLPGADFAGAGGGNGEDEVEVMGPGEGEVGGAGDGRMIGVRMVETDDVEGLPGGVAVGAQDGEGVEGVAVAKAGGLGEVFGGQRFGDFDLAGAGAADEDAAALTRIFRGGV